MYLYIDCQPVVRSTDNQDCLSAFVLEQLTDILVLYDFDSNAILVEPAGNMKGHSDLNPNTHIEGLKPQLPATRQ
jgi:hypothetical protein